MLSITGGSLTNLKRQGSKHKRKMNLATLQVKLASSFELFLGFDLVLFGSIWVSRANWLETTVYNVRNISAYKCPNFP
jgi:hypothetical protein